MARHGRDDMSKALIAANLQLKRAYESPSATDGKRVLIDRLWPRGVKKADAAIDYWFKELAPSTELRKRFGHDLARWDDFRRRFKTELRLHTEQIDRLRDMARHGKVTLIYSAHDELHNDAVVLRDFLLDRE